jgi:KDO2-lipid IV(A) lauroyltransferase
VVQVSGWEHVEAAEATGGGILFITRTWAASRSAQYFSLHKPITVLYRPPKKAVLQPHQRRPQPRQHAPGPRPTWAACAG